MVVSGVVSGVVVGVDLVLLIDVGILVLCVIGVRPWAYFGAEFGVLCVLVLVSFVMLFVCVVLLLVLS